MAPAAVVGWDSHRLKRVVRSTLAAETMGLATSIEQADFCRAALAELTCSDFSFKNWEKHANQWRQLWVVDAKSTFDHLSREAGLPDDKRLAIDVAALPEIKSRGIDDIIWLPGPVMPADCLTKFDKANEALKVLTQTGRWTLRETAESQQHRASEATKRQQRNVTKRSAQQETNQRQPGVRQQQDD